MNEPKQGQRKLVAIFAADVAEYSRLMNADEAATFRLLQADRELAARFIAQGGGRIANTAGDSILAEFPSAVDALACALSLQERIAVLNDEVNENRRITFRIGVHVGEVVVSGGDLFGDAVNVAARMQSLATPGCVCLSEVAHLFVQQSVSTEFEDLGPQQVKNISEPIRAYMARPLSASLANAIPPVHRIVEAHLARRFHQACERAVGPVTAREELTPAEFSYLATLDDAPGISHADLCQRLGIEDATASMGLLVRLQERGLLETIDDHEGSHLRLTSLGTTIRRRLRVEILSSLDALMAPLSDPERDLLRQLLVRVLHADQIRRHPSPTLA
jgi:adenylate cyclase